MTIEVHTIQWRAWVGPKWLPADDPAFWEWSGVDEGATYDMAALATTLAADLEPTATSLTLASAAAWPSAGGGWIARGAAGEALEYVSYIGKSGSTLTGLVRETTGLEQTGHHTTGAIVRWWVPLATAENDLQVEESSDNLRCLGRWRATLKGANMPQGLLRNGHLCQIEQRTITATGTGWGAWKVAWLGWIRDAQVSDDPAGKAEWTATVVSSADMLGALSVPGVHNGPINAAPAGQIQGSAELATAYKEEHSGAIPSPNAPLGPDQAIDKDVSTVYVTEHFLGASNHPTSYLDANRNCADQLHISPYVGQGPGYRWIQFRPGARIRIWNADGVAMVSDGSMWLDDHAAPDNKGFAFVVICENTDLFVAENPDYGGATLIELSDNTVGTLYDLRDQSGVVSPTYSAQDWWDGFAPAGGGMAMTRLSTENWEEGVCIWGDVDPADVMAHWEAALRLWDGDPLPAVQPGQTVRRIWSGGMHDPTGWTVDWVSDPGRYLSSDTIAWLLLGLPGLNLSLAQDIDDDDDTLYVRVGDTASFERAAGLGHGAGRHRENRLRL